MKPTPESSAVRAIRGSRQLSKKDEALNKLDGKKLLELARSVSEKTIDGQTSRTDLTKIIGAALSLEEIRRKLVEMGVLMERGGMRDKALTIRAIGQVFLVIYAIAVLIVSGFTVLVLYASSSYWWLNIGANAFLELVALVFFMIFDVLSLLAMISLPEKSFSNGGGIISGLIGLVTSAIGIFYYGAAIFGLTYWVNLNSNPGHPAAQLYYTSLGVLLQSVYPLSLDLTFVSIGTFFLLRSGRFPLRGVSLAAGMVYLLASTTGEYAVMSYGFTYVYFVGPFLLVAAGALGLSCFLSERSAKRANGSLKLSRERLYSDERQW
jgi:hypothetical protein